MAKYSYLKPKTQKPKWYEYQKPAPPPPPKSGAAGFRGAVPGTSFVSQGQPMPPVSGIRQTENRSSGLADLNARFASIGAQQNTMMTDGGGNQSWVNPLPAQHNRPAYFNNQSTPAQFNRWLDSFEQPEKALEVVEKDYQNWKSGVDAIQEQNANLYNNPYKNPEKPSFAEMLGYNPTSNAFGEMLGVGWKDPNVNAETLYGQRYMQENATKDYPVRPDFTNKFLTDYQGREENKKKAGKDIALSFALNQARPFFQPITDEQGNVIAAPPLTQVEYMDGVADGTIYDPNMPDSKPQYGKTALVIENGQMIPYEMWYRSKTNNMKLMGGNWNLPMFSDTEGYQYNAPIMNLNGGALKWLDIQNFVNLKNFENKTNKVGMKTDGTMGKPGQAMPFGFNPGIDFQIPNQIQSGTEMVEDPNLGEDLGGGGGWGGGGGGGFGPSYWGNPGSSGYYGSQNYSPGYWGNSGGYGSNGYSGSNSYGPNYQSNQYGLRKGQYFSQLARWVI